jgi:Ca-activated chloride channel family protein
MNFPHAATLRRLVSHRLIHTLLFAFLTLSFQLLLFNRTASAQDETSADSEEVVRVRTDLVVVPVFVADAHGRRIKGLNKSDFEIRDNGQRVEATHFAAGAERVALLFLLDASGSARDIINEQRETALAVFSHFGARSRVAVMQFRERPELTVPFTNDLRAARRGFQIAALADQHTAIFDAALAAVRAFHDEGRPEERRIVVLFSDGLDTASSTRAAAAVEEARAAGVSFYVIHIPLFEPRDGRLAPRTPSKGFRDLAELTGGQFFVVGNARASLDPHAEYNLRPIFQAIADDLLGQYLLGYHASAAVQQPGFHRVEVRLMISDKGKLRVRQLRDGYESKGNDK